MAEPINLQIPDAVEASGLSRSRIYEALKLGELRAIKAGRRTLIPVCELEAYLASLPSYASGGRP
jgi:excisionase family DNA binding protein